MITNENKNIIKRRKIKIPHTVRSVTCWFRQKISHVEVSHSVQSGKNGLFQKVPILGAQHWAIFAKIINEELKRWPKSKTSLNPITLTLSKLSNICGCTNSIQ